MDGTHYKDNEGPTLHTTKLSNKGTAPSRTKQTTHASSSSSSSFSSSSSSLPSSSTSSSSSSSSVSHISTGEDNNNGASPPLRMDLEAPTESESLFLSSSEREWSRDYDRDLGLESLEEMGEEQEEDEEEDDTIPVEQRLMNHLMKHYERSVRPVKNASDTVLVRMGLTLTQIFDMVSRFYVIFSVLSSAMKTLARSSWFG